MSVVTIFIGVGQNVVQCPRGYHVTENGDPQRACLLLCVFSLNCSRRVCDCSCFDVEQPVSTALSPSLVPCVMLRTGALFEQSY